MTPYEALSAHLKKAKTPPGVVVPAFIIIHFVLHKIMFTFCILYLLTFNLVPANLTFTIIQILFCNHKNGNIFIKTKNNISNKSNSTTFYS